MPTIKLRKRRISGNRFSLVADIYSKTERRTESLGLYIDAKPADKIQREHNRQILVTARGIVARKQNEMAKPEIYARAEKEALKQAERCNLSFVEFCQGVIGKIDGPSKRVYETALKYFLLFLDVKDIKCGGITTLMVDEFREHLPTAKKLRSDAAISQNSAATYFAAFKSLLIDAYKGEHLVSDIGRNAESLPTKKTNKDHLTVDELISLYQSECEYPLLKEMAMFSALTGLRFSDCLKLDRDEVKGDVGNYYLDFTQKKRSVEATIPISDQAFTLLPPQGKNPFATIDYDNMQRPLKKWVTAAGIEKKVTFHTFRHTYANILLANGVDLFTVSGLMGHKSVRSTQVYTKPVDEKKLMAAQTMNIPLTQKKLSCQE